MTCDPQTTPIPARLHLLDYGGNSAIPCEIVGETAKRYRIRAIQRMRLAGRSRFLEAGDTALVPKHAVTRA